MHGYTHNRLCQCSHHPKYVVGTGLEDFETCERFFSASNACARVTRHASRFHRHQLIHNFLRQWDEDKFLSSAQFIRNNYLQALSILRDNTLVLQKELPSKNFTEAGCAIRAFSRGRAAGSTPLACPASKDTSENSTNDKYERCRHADLRLNILGFGLVGEETLGDAERELPISAMNHGSGRLRAWLRDSLQDSCQLW